MKLHCILGVLLVTMAAGRAYAEPEQRVLDKQGQTARATSEEGCLESAGLSPAAYDHLAQCRATGANPMPCYARGTRDDIVAAELSDEAREELIVCMSQADPEEQSQGYHQHKSD